MFEYDINDTEPEAPEADLIPPLTRIARNLELLLFWLRPIAVGVCLITVHEIVIPILR